MKKYRSLINMDLLRVIVLTFFIAKIVGWYLERDINARKALFLMHQGERFNRAPVANSVSPFVERSRELKIDLDDKTKGAQ